MVHEQEKGVGNDEYTLGRDYVASARYSLLIPFVVLPPSSWHPTCFLPRRLLQFCVRPFILTPICFHRLALLHLLIKAQFGLLHPVIKDEIKTDEGKVKEGLRIADVGTGTG